LEAGKGGGNDKIERVLEDREQLHLQEGHNDKGSMPSTATVSPSVNKT